MLTKRDRNAAYKALEEVQRLRIANVRLAMSLLGDWPDLAKATGQQAQFLKSIAGDNPVRTIGEKLARSLEFSLGLPALWMDSKH